MKRRLWILYTLFFSVSLVSYGLVLYSLVAFSAPQNLPSVDVHYRKSGYTMGDFLQMQVRIVLPSNQSIDPESMPLLGRVKPWLDMRALKLQQEKNSVNLQVTWQLFATVEIAQQLKTPEFILKTKEHPIQTIVIPAQAFYYSPVFAPPPLKEIKRHHYLPPPLFDTKTPLIGMVISTGVALLLGFVYCWLKDLIPWWPFKAGPMLRLSTHFSDRSFKSLSTSAFAIKDLRCVHAALNETAGVSLYPHNLARLFEKAPYLLPEKKRITHFFNQSWAHFYPAEKSGRTFTGSTVIDTVETQKWIHRAALAERLYLRKKQQ